MTEKMKADISLAKRRRRAERFKTNFPLTLLAIPGILYFVIFHYIPLFGLVLPFKDYKVSLGLWKSPWTGLKNFEFLFKGESAMLALKNTVIYNFIFIILGTVVSLLIALALYEMSKKAVKAYQTMLLIPYFISWVVIAMAFQAFLDVEYGVFNKMLQFFGKEKIMWYGDPKPWPIILIVSNVWKGMGYNAIIYYGSLMGIDSELFEAAKIDGASRLKQIWYITLPLLKSIIVTLFILNVGSILRADFGLFYNLPLNSPLLYKSTEVIDTFVYRSMIELGDTGMAAAAGFFQSVVGFFLVITTNKIVNKIDSSQGLF